MNCTSVSVSFLDKVTSFKLFILEEDSTCLEGKKIKIYAVKPGYNALEGTGPQKRYRRESVIRGK